MNDDPEAMKKLCLRVKSQFLEASDTLFSFGEVNTTVFILLDGWVTVCIGGVFGSDEDNGNNTTRQESRVARRDTIPMDARVQLLDQSAKKNQATGGVEERIRRINGVMASVALVSSALGNRKEKSELAYIPAPAFFRESLLFLSEPVPAPYSARCLTRAEFATFTLADIQSLLGTLPYLQRRYTDFSTAVREAPEIDRSVTQLQRAWRKSKKSRGKPDREQAKWRRLSRQASRKANNTQESELVEHTFSV
jgi:CRP-like cAMP-binding protein